MQVPYDDLPISSHCQQPVVGAERQRRHRRQGPHPQRDIDRILDATDAPGVTITHVAETHVHNDYVSGGLVLALVDYVKEHLPRGDRRIDSVSGARR